MNRLLIAATAALSLFLLASPAEAQGRRGGPGARPGGSGRGGPGGGSGGGARPQIPSPQQVVSALDTDGDGKISTAEAQAAGRRGQFVLRADADGDGFVTLAELQAARQAMGQRGKKKGRRGQGQSPFAKLDADGDGKISTAEAQAAGAQRAAKIMAADADGDGFVTQAELQAHAQAQAVDATFKRLDKNNDGTLDASELSGRRAQKVKQADADGDGNVTKAELQAHLAAQAAKRQAQAQLVQKFRSADADSDGKLSAAEWPANATATHAAVDADSDGQVTPREIGAYLKANNNAPF